MTVRFLSVCSGIEAASVAFAPLGWQAVGFAEIERFPCEVLAHRHGSNMPGQPLATNGVPNFGDFTTIPLGPASPLGRVDLLCGGTPCQAFSVAGKRGSLVDARGNLTIAFVELAHGLVRQHGLRNALWENVPGVLSTGDNAFGCFLGGLVGADYPLAGCDRPRAGADNWFWGWSDKERIHKTRWPRQGMVAGPRARVAWRVLDAQYFGLAQRRERVFVVVDFGTGADPASVLFERAGVRRHPPARGEAWEGAAGDIGTRAESRCVGGAGDIAGTVSAKWAKGTGGPAGDEAYNLVAHALRGERFDASEDGTGRGTPIVPVAYRTSPNCGAWETGDRTDALTTATDPNAHVLAVAFDLRGRDGGAMPEGPHATANLRAASGGSSRSYVAQTTVGEQWAVRRLTPRECERLQGFDDDHTAIPRGGKPATECADGPRYKSLGNSWAVPIVRWIGARIAAHMPEEAP